MINSAGIIAAAAAANARRAQYDFDDDEFDDDDDYEPESKYEKVKYKVAKSFFWIFASSAVIASLLLVYHMTPIARYKNEKKQGVKQILDSAHSDAVNSAYTINLADYEITSKLKAKCDSLYYARKVSHFIYINGNKFVKFKPVIKEVYGVRHIDLDFGIDQNLICKDPKFNKYLTGYKKSVQQLAVQRRISNQK